MYRESELTFLDFVDHDRFELNAQMFYLFHQFYDKVSDHLEDKKEF